MFGLRSFIIAFVAAALLAATGTAGAYHTHFVADNCNYNPPQPTSYITRSGSATVALRARYEGYQWAGRYLFSSTIESGRLTSALPTSSMRVQTCALERSSRSGTAKMEANVYAVRTGGDVRVSPPHLKVYAGKVVTDRRKTRCSVQGPGARKRKGRSRNRSVVWLCGR